MSVIETVAWSGAGVLPAEEVEPDFSDLCFHDMDTQHSSPPAFLGNNVEEFGQLLEEEIAASTSLPIGTHLVVAPEYLDGVGFMEALAPLNYLNKDALTNILESFEASNCSRAVACVNKKHAQFKAIVSSFLAAGFSVTASHCASSEYIWLMTEL